MEDKYIEKIDEILKRQLTQKSFELWIGIRENISNKCWEKPTSSSKKYHRKEDQGGRVPSVAEHTWELIYSADKIIQMFEDVINKDVIFLSIALHDSYKYGLVKTCPSTESRHDKLIADLILKNKKIYLQVLNEQDVNKLETAVRYHSGKWSTDADKNMYEKFTPEVLFLHTLDMLSSKNLLKIL
jgi:23S rRNA maturation-related 3'-5' exoribonuclease YhaM